MPSKTKKRKLPSPEQLTNFMEATADWVASLPTQPSPCEDKRKLVLTFARAAGWLPENERPK